MLVGSAGCGKTVLMNEKLSTLSDNYAVTNIPFNFYTTSGNVIELQITNCLYVIGLGVFKFFIFVMRCRNASENFRKTTGKKSW